MNDKLKEGLIDFGYWCLGVIDYGVKLGIWYLLAMLVAWIMDKDVSGLNFSGWFILLNFLYMTSSIESIKVLLKLNNKKNG